MALQAVLAMMILLNIVGQNCFHGKKITIPCENYELKRFVDFSKSDNVRFLTNVITYDHGLARRLILVANHLNCFEFQCIF